MMYYEKYDRCPHGKEWGSQGAYDMQRCQCPPQNDDESVAIPLTDEEIEAIRRTAESGRMQQTRYVRSLCKTIDTLRANQRTPGYIECCPGCGVPRFYENGDKGSDGGCDNGNLPVDAEFDCPLRRSVPQENLR